MSAEAAGDLPESGRIVVVLKAYTPAQRSFGPIAANGAPDGH